MKGKNTLKVNVETMYEAVRLWVAQEFVADPAPNVVAVRQITPPPVYQDGESVQQPGYYEIDIETVEKPCPE